MTTLDASLFASDEVHAREVTFPDGQKHTFWFKEVPSSKFRGWRDAESSENEAVRASAAARLIAQSLCNEDGTPALTQAEAESLKARVADLLSREVLAVCGFDGKNVEVKKDSPPVETNGSGTS